MFRTKTMAEHKVLQLSQNQKETQPKKMLTITEEQLNKNIKMISHVSESMKELTKRGEEIEDISFSISNTSDINELYEKLSNKSNEKFDITYEGYGEEVDKQFNEFVEDTLTNFVKENKGFDKEIKNLTKNLYQDLCGSVVPDLKPRNNMNTTNNDKSKTTNLFTKAPINTNISQDEQAVKLRNDLSGVPIMINGDITQNTGYGKFGANSKKESESNKQTISSREGMKEKYSEEDNEINIEVKKKNKNKSKKSNKQIKHNMETDAGKEELIRSEADEDAKDLIRDSAKNNSSNMS